METVVDAFARGLDHVLATQASRSNLTIYQVDGAIPPNAWSSAAALLARDIEALAK
jgi:hypothetical protein